MATLRAKSTKAGVIYFVDFIFQGKRYRKSTKTSDRKLAELFLKDIEIKIARETFGFADLNRKKERLREFLEKYGQFSSATKAENTYALDRHSLRLLINHLGDVLLKEITPKMIEEFKVRRLEQVKPASVNVELRHLKAAFETAVKWSILEKNPLKSVKQVKVRGKNLPKFLSREQVTTLLNQIADADFRNLICFYLYTGCRRNEALNLRWDDIDLQAGTVAFHVTKSGESRIVPINAKLAEILQKMERNGEKPFNFNRWFVTHRFKRYLKEAGINGSDNLHLHSLRHTFASHLVMDGVDLYTVAKLLGHSSVAVTQMYAHLAPDYLKLSVDRLRF